MRSGRSLHPRRVAAVAAAPLLLGALIAPAQSISATDQGAGSAGVMSSNGTAAGPDRARHPAKARHKTPKRVVLIVVDQLRREFIDAYDMRNVRRLMRGGISFPNAYLGHMASETVISHNVMTSGQLPKHMGWSDEWFRDVDGVLGEPGDLHVTGSLSLDQFEAVIEDKGYPKLDDYLQRSRPGKFVAAIGQKGYAAYTMGGPGADARIAFSGRSYDCDGDGVNNWRGPAGDQVPAYLSEPECGRFYIDSDRELDYGTATTSPAWMYPLDGNRDVPGYDPAHLGGDPWVTDAAFEVMDHEDWSGLLLTYGGLDKAGHMWGGLNDEPPYPGGDPMTHIAAAARTADEQVGRVVARLKADGLLDETLVVLTTDHGQNAALNYHGLDGPGRGYYNWYYGEDADESYLDPQPLIEQLVDETDGNVEASMQDSAIRTWLRDRSPRAKKRAAAAVAELPDVRATYTRAGARYALRWRAPRAEFAKREWTWFRKRAQRIVNTAAAPYGPDVIGLLADNTSYGVAGDHGGAQESVQRIPIAFYGAGTRGGAKRAAAMRSVDIMPTILKAMRIRETHRTDGRAYPLR